MLFLLLVAPLSTIQNRFHWRLRRRTCPNCREYGAFPFDSSVDTMKDKQEDHLSGEKGSSIIMPESTVERTSFCPSWIYLLQRHGTLDLDPINDVDPYNWPLWKILNHVLLSSSDNSPWDEVQKNWQLHRFHPLWWVHAVDGRLCKLFGTYFFSNSLCSSSKVPSFLPVNENMSKWRTRNINQPRKSPLILSSSKPMDWAYMGLLPHLWCLSHYTDSVLIQLS